MFGATKAVSCLNSCKAALGRLWAGAACEGTACEGSARVRACEGSACATAAIINTADDQRPCHVFVT